MIGFRSKLNLFWAVPALILIRIMRPFVTVRFGSIANSRIGHLTIDSSYFLATLPRHRNESRTFHWFWFDGTSCNQQWSKMVECHLFVRPWVRYLDKLNRLIPGGGPHCVPILLGSRDREGFFQKNVERFQLSAADNDFARRWLKERGWQESERFVCLLVRDDQYLARTQISSKQEDDAARWAYHSYRDSDIDAYRMSVQYLLDQGYWVVRMGKIAAKPLNVNHLRFIDYPFVSDQADILDIWLTLNCSFFISTATGLDILPSVYKSPSSLFVNALPLPHLHSWHRMTWVPKYLIWKNSGKFLTLREHLQHIYFKSKDYDSAGISVVSLSAEEILAAVIEHEKRVTNDYQDTPEARNMQIAFWAKMRQWEEFEKLHNWVHPQARVGSDYLRKMGDIFFE